VVITLDIWDFLVITVICWAIVEMNRNYLRAKHKIPEREKKGPEYPETLLIAGLVLFSLGLAIYFGVYLSVGTGAWFTGSLIPIFVGFSLVVAYVMVRPKKKGFRLWK